MTRNYALPGKCMRNDLLQRAEFTVKPLLCKLCINIDCASGCEATSSFTNSSPNGSGTDHDESSDMTSVTVQWRLFDATMCFA